MIKKLLFASLCMLSACESTPLAVKYSASSSRSTTGTFKVEEFRYLEAENGKTKPNQVPNSAAGNILLSENVSKYIADAYIAEFRQSGSKVTDNAGLIMNGKIAKLKADDLGFSVDWTLSIIIQISNTSGKPLFEKNIEVKKTYRKYDFNAAFGSVIKESFEQLVSDPKFKELMK